MSGFKKQNSPKGKKPNRCLESSLALTIQTPSDKTPGKLSSRVRSFSDECCRSSTSRNVMMTTDEWRRSSRTTHRATRPTAHEIPWQFPPHRTVRHFGMVKCHLQRGQNAATSVYEFNSNMSISCLVAVYVRHITLAIVIYTCLLSILTYMY